MTELDDPLWRYRTAMRAERYERIARRWLIFVMVVVGIGAVLAIVQLLEVLP